MSEIKIGNRIKFIRKKLNMTQTQFGENFGANHSIVSHWENNMFKPNKERAIMIAKLGNVPLESLLTGVGFDERIK